MDDPLDIETDLLWSAQIKKLRKTFSDIEDLKDVVFLIGIQELGKGYQELSKDEKLDVMHIGICRLLSQYGYYSFTGFDKDGWPHWEVVSPLPALNEDEKDLLLKKAVLEYFAGT